MVLLLVALFFFVTAPLCVVADTPNAKSLYHFGHSENEGTSWHQYLSDVLVQLPPSVKRVAKNLETIPIVSVHRKKEHEIPGNLASHHSPVSHRPPVLAKGPHPSYTPHTIIKANRAIETPDRFAPRQVVHPDIISSSLPLSLSTPDVVSGRFGYGLVWPRQLVWDPTLIQKPSSRALSGYRVVEPTFAALSPSKSTVRAEKRDIKLPGSQNGGTRLLTRPQAFSLNKGGPQSSSNRGMGGAIDHLKPYINHVFPQLPYPPPTRTWTTRTTAAATNKHRHGFHNHQLPFRRSPSSSSSLSPSRRSSPRLVHNIMDAAANDADKKGDAQWIALGICLFFAVVVILYLLTGGLRGERKGRQQRRSAANDSSNNDDGAGHTLQSLRTSRSVSKVANTSAAVPENTDLPSKLMNPLRQNPPTPPRMSWQWGGMRSVGQVEEDRVYNPYTYPYAPDHSPPAYPSLSRAESTTENTSKIPTTSSGLPLTTLSSPAPAARAGVSRSNSNASSSTLFDNSSDAYVADMLASRNKKNRESWESWNKKCLQTEKESGGVEEQKDVEKKGASKFVTKWPGFRM